MASDTATRSITVTTDDCAGFAEPAEILTRLTPDDLHPARLAGPHAWHPWGLTTAPPTDRHLRLILPTSSRADAAEQLVDRLQSQLVRTPWPPEDPLDIRRDSNRLDCRDNDARRALVEVAIATDSADHGHAEVVTRNGWPILGELAALNDRLHCIDVDQPSRTDLAELTSWVKHKMSETPGTHRLAASLPQILRDQTRNYPTSADRLRTIVTNSKATAGHQTPVLSFLSEQLDQRQRCDPPWVR